MSGGDIVLSNGARLALIRALMNAGGDIAVRLVPELRAIKGGVVITAPPALSAERVPECCGGLDSCLGCRNPPLPTTTPAAPADDRIEEEARRRRYDFVRAHRSFPGPRTFTTLAQYEAAIDARLPPVTP